jgi:hypothetical protein
MFGANLYLGILYLKVNLYSFFDWSIFLFF